MKRLSLVLSLLVLTLGWSMNANAQTDDHSTDANTSKNQVVFTLSDGSKKY